ncbi:MAG: hypothetical protein EA384_09770 [Spirochaetaceae bacterium]|nr:MAG: hypothetical protein EA384_09770 [Spirochaetaceae bacterium]
MNQNRARRRDRRRARRHIHAPRHFNTFLRSALGPTLGWLFRIETRNRQLVRDLKPPWVLIANHACVLDPFMINCQIPAPVHYVVSDSNFRSRLVEFGLGLVGSIPKTKAMSDLETVKNIVKVKASRGIIGVYPEGQSTWDGHTLPIYPATAKLLKALKIPVVAAKVQGAFLSLPRWARSYRRGRIVISFDLVYTTEQLKAAAVDEIYDGIRRALEHDEFEFQRQSMVPYRGSARAEYLEIVLCVCPHCHSIGRLLSAADMLTCEQCGYRVRFSARGFFESDGGFPLYHDTIRSWNLWQSGHLGRTAERHAASQSCDPLFEEPRVIVKIGYKSSPLEPFARGRLQMHADRIILLPEDGAAPVVFLLSDIEGINVQNSEHLEFYARGSLYRVTIADRRGNSYKWHLTVRHLQSLSAGARAASGDSSGA